MRRLLLFLMSISLLCTCSSFQSNIKDDEPQEPPEFGLRMQAQIMQAQDPAVLVPVIRFQAVVDDDSAGALTRALSLVVEAGAQAIVLELNTPGGSVDAGFLISKAIEDSPVPVVCVVDGEADSMGFYILQACHHRLMTKRSVLMAHFSYYPTASGPLTIPRLKDLMDSLLAGNKAATEHECKHLKMPLEQCRAKIAGSWWMDWREAFEVGAVEEGVDSVSVVVNRLREQVLKDSGI